MSSFCIMVLELVAGRMISRYLGSSLYTWTSVIGVVLAGIAAGNYMGGLLADRRKARPTLALLFALSSVTCVGITVLNLRVGEWVFLWSLPWSLRVGTHVAIVFLVPSLLLGMISPVAAKAAIDRSRTTGRTIGSVYAWGVVGSIVGTFATGFWLIAAFGTAVVVWAVGGVLAVMGILFGVGGRLPGAWGAVFLVLAVLGTGPWPWAERLGVRLTLREARNPDLLYVDESQYSHIRVVRVPGPPERRNLHLDKLLHSTIVVGHPGELQYGYERIYGAVTRSLAGARDSLNTLTIGGGGYVFPRWLDLRFPESRTEVVEIDPAVTRAAVQAFELPEDNGFVISHEDGRAYVGRLVERKRRGERQAPYDFVYLDVFDDYSVPYQLTTIECLRLVRELLAADGAFLMNMIDVYAVGGFLGSMIVTMEEVFPNVTVLAEGQPVSAQPEARNTYVLVGSARAADFPVVVAGYDDHFGLYRLTRGEMDDLRARAGQRLLTDDWAPVENLLAPVVRRSSREIAGGMLLDRARKQLARGEAAAAARTAARAAGLQEGSGEADEVRARALLLQGDRDGAADALRRVLAARPRDAETWFRLGVLLRDLQRPEESIEALGHAVELRPEDLEALNELGIALVNVGRVAEGIARFEEVLRRDPEHAKARRNLDLARSL